MQTVVLLDIIKVIDGNDLAVAADGKTICSDTFGVRRWPGVKLALTGCPCVPDLLR
jgi:hypothetical protein